MAESSAEARQEVENARRAVASELDDLGDAARAALDVPARVRRNPVRTAGIAGGAAFLLLGGPKRVARAAERRFFPKRAARVPRLLPREVDRTIDQIEPEEERERVRGHLERDFATYLQKRHPQEALGARQSAWKTYDLFLGIVGAAAARELVKKLFEVPKEVRVEEAAERASVEVAAEEAKADARASAGDTRLPSASRRST